MTASLPLRIIYTISRCILKLTAFRIPGIHSLNSVWAGVLFGILDKPALDRLDHHYYTTNPMYRRDSYTTRGLFDWEQEALDAFFPAAGNILVIGAGGGREALALINKGYTVEAWECNGSLVAYAQEVFTRQGLANPVRLSPRDDVPETGRQVDGAIIGWTVYSHIQGSHARMNLLARLKDRLKAGAPLLVSYAYLCGPNALFGVTERVANAIRRMRGREPVEYGDFMVPTFSHYFPEEQIRKELTEPGFRLAYLKHDGVGRAVAVADRAG